MRRRRRRDALRLQLVRVFDMIAKEGTLSKASTITDNNTQKSSGPASPTSRSSSAYSTHSVIDPVTGSLSHTFTDYIDGARIYLEAESPTDKEVVPAVREIKTYFSSFIGNLIGSFSRKYKLLYTSNTLLSVLYTQYSIIYFK